MASIVPLQINFMFHRILSAHNKLNIFERRTAPRSTTIILYSLLFRQYRIILSADTASEVRQMLSQKRR